MLTSQILLWTAVVVQALLIAALARQVGILHERIAPAGALTLHQKVEVGEVASPMTVTTIEGAPIEIGGKREGRSQLLFFASPDCPVCKTLLPVVRSAASNSRAVRSDLNAGRSHLGAGVNAAANRANGCCSSGPSSRRARRASIGTNGTEQ